MNKILFIIILVVGAAQSSADKLDLFLPFHGPYKSAQVNSELNIFTDAVFGKITHSLLASNYVSLRALETLLNINLFWGTAVYFHEIAHMRIAEKYNPAPNLKFYWYQGLIEHKFTAELNKDLEIIIAGINASQLTSRKHYYSASLFKSNSKNLSYFMNSLLGTLYAANTLRKKEKFSNDVVNWEHSVTKLGLEAPSVMQQTIRSGTLNLINLNLWFAALNIIDYIFYNNPPSPFYLMGDKDKHVLFPHTSYYRSAERDWFELAVLMKNGSANIDLSYVSSFDLKSGRVEVAADNVFILRQISLGQSLGISFDKGLAGIFLRSTIKIFLDSDMFVRANHIYSYNDVLNNHILGNCPGSSFEIGLGLLY